MSDLITKAKDILSNKEDRKKYDEEIFDKKYKNNYDNNKMPDPKEEDEDMPGL